MLTRQKLQNSKSYAKSLEFSPAQLQFFFDDNYIYIYTDTNAIRLPCSLARAGNNKPKLIRSILGAGIVQDTFAAEAGGGEEDMTLGYFYCYFYAQAKKSSVS